MTTSVTHIFTVVSFTALLFVSNGQFPLPNVVPVNISALNKIVSICPTGWMKASAPKPGYELTRAQLCVRVNLPGKRWVDATGQCRQSKGFMVKLDSVLTLEDVTLFDYLRQRGIKTIWSGMHHKYGTLLWDDLRPRMVKGYIGLNEPYGWKRRGYTFDQSSYRLGNKTCGYLTLGADDVMARRSRREVQVSSKTVKSHVARDGPRKTNADDRPTKSPSKVPDTIPILQDLLMADQNLREKNSTTSSSNKVSATMGPLLVLTTTSTTTTTDQSDLEDNENHHPIPTTPLPVILGEIPTHMSTYSPANSTVQSAKGTSLPAATSSITPLPQSNAVVDDFLSRPLDAGFDTHGAEMVIHDDLLPKPGEPSILFNTQNRFAVQSKSSVVSSESIDSNEAAKAILVGQMVNARQEINSSANVFLKKVNISGVASTTVSTLSRTTVVTTKSKTLSTTPQQLSSSTRRMLITATTSSTPMTTTSSKSQTFVTNQFPTTSSLNVETTSSQMVEDSKEKLTNMTATDTENKTVSTSDLENSKENSDGSSSSESSPTVIQLTTAVPNVTDTGFTGLPSNNLTKETSTPNEETPSPTPFSDLTSTRNNNILLDNPPTAQTTDNPLTIDNYTVTIIRDIQAKDTDSKELGSNSESMDMSMEDMWSSEQLDYSPIIQYSSTTLPTDFMTSTTTFDPNTTLDANTTLDPNTAFDHNITLDPNTTTQQTTRGTPQLNETRQDTGASPPGQSKEVTVDAQAIPRIDSRDATFDSSEELTFRNPMTGAPVTPKPMTGAPIPPSPMTGAPVPPKDVLSLGDCEDERSSVCVTEAIDSLSLVSHCDRNWYGHRLLDKCYNPVGYTLTEIEARQHCLRYSAALAAADTDFYGNITVMLLADFVQTRGFERRVWLDTSLNLNMPVGDGLCSALDSGRILRVSCTIRLPFICQKDAQFARPLEDYRNSIDAVTYIQNMTSFHPQTLPCPLGLTAFDDVIVWFKDGRPILDRTDDDRNSFEVKNGQLPNSLVIDLSILERVGELDSRFFKPAMLQGEYWCEIWRKEPFHRVTSHRIFLKFTDVITLRGRIITEPASYEDAAMFNRMGIRVGLPAAMELRLTSMNKNVTHFMRGVYPIVRDVITFIKNTNPVNGWSEFVTYICTATGDLTPSMRGNLADLYLSTFYEALVQNEDFIRTEWRLTLPLTKAISVSMTDLCPSKNLEDKVTGHSATFMSTLANTQVMSVDFCNGMFSGTAYCKGNLMTGAYWDTWRISQSCQPVNKTPAPNVNSNVNPNLGVGQPASYPTVRHVTVLPTVTKPESDMMEHTEPPVVAGNVEHIKVSLNQILSQTDNLTHTDITAVAQLANSAAAVDKPPREVSQILIDTVNKVLDSPQEELMRAEKESNAPSSDNGTIKYQWANKLKGLLHI